MKWLQGFVGVILFVIGSIMLVTWADHRVIANNKAAAKRWVHRVWNLNPNHPRLLIECNTRQCQVTFVRIVGDPGEQFDYQPNPHTRRSGVRRLSLECRDGVCVEFSSEQGYSDPNDWGN